MKRDMRCATKNKITNHNCSGAPVPSELTAAQGMEDTASAFQPAGQSYCGYPSW